MDNQQKRDTPLRHRRAMTLVELLVVLAIIALLLAVAAPLVRNTSRDRRVREASRALSGYINGARSLAAQRGRPVGIWIERFQTEQTNRGMYSTTVFTAEVPPPYAGFDEDTKARLAVYVDHVQIIFSDPLLNNSEAIIKRGDAFSIRFDFRGPVYPGLRRNDGVYVLRLLSRSDMPEYARANPQGVHFQIFRGPVKSLRQPLRLPANTAIDLSVSGFAADGNEFRPPNPPGQMPLDPLKPGGPVVILFNPSGDVESVYAFDNNGNGVVNNVPASSSVHLLVGRARQVVGPSASTAFPGNLYLDNDIDVSNIMDMSSLWVSISHRTGVVTTAENARILRNAAGNWEIGSAREFALSKVGMGGR